MSEQEVAPAPKPVAAAEHPSSKGLLLAAVTLVWMGAMLWSARATITGRADAEMEVTSSAYALPGAISAAVVTGSTVALAVLAFLRRRGELGASTRFAIATGSGLLVGVLGALVIVTINTEGWLYAVMGGTVAAAATIGGALAGFRIPRVVTAIGCASVAVFVVGFVLNLFQGPLLDAFSSSSASSRADANQWISYGQGVVSGLAAGIVSYRVLRRARARSGELDVPWPLYGLAGAGAGLLLVIAEILTRTAGSRVLDLAGRVSELELVVQQMLSGARLNSALIILFVGAISATILVGRTISPAAEEDEEDIADAAPTATTGEPASDDTDADDTPETAAAPAKPAAPVKSQARPTSAS
jgi:iron complex transport system permease protein